MIKSLYKTLFITIFLFNFINIAPIFASLGEEDDNTVPFHFKLGAGDPNVKNPNGTKAHVLERNIPCIDSLDPDVWLEVHNNPFTGVTHYLGALPSINLNPTTNIFLEYLQFAFLPQIKKGGKLSEEDTIYSKTFKMIQPAPISNVGCHFFMPSEIAEGAGVVLLMPGSKGARLSEIKRAKDYAKQGVPCLIPDFVSTARTNNKLGGNSTIGNQLAVSFFGNALSILLLHNTLQEWDAIDPEKVVWDCESIGSTQALLALMPEVVAKFEEDFIPPAYMMLNDFAPVLTTLSFKESPFWAIPKTIWGGEKDKFTPLSQVEEFLRQGPLDHPTLLEKHDGFHDARSLDGDTIGQKGGTYDLKDATNYTGLCAFMKSSIEEIRDSVKHLGVDTDEGGIMGALETPFGNFRLHLRLENTDLSPMEVSDRIRLLPKGATFGPGSQRKATELRNEVLKTVLEYALPVVEEIEEDL
ncbi:MAG TPA: hypothetical protein DD412_01155 [Holosporales bacterium]|nr:hypothetical protein [Holosporales bacterium]